MGARKVFLAIGLIALGIALIVLSLEINEAARFHKRIFALPHAGDNIQWHDTDGTHVKMRAEWLIEVVIPHKLDSRRAWLLQHTLSELWAGIYILAGLGGAVLFFLLLLFEPGLVGRTEVAANSELRSVPLIVRLALGAGMGLLCFFLVQVPASAASGAYSKVLETKATEAVSSDDVVSKLVLLPILSGLFLSTALKRMHAWLEKTPVFNAGEDKKSAKAKDKKQEEKKP